MNLPKPKIVSDFQNHRIQDVADHAERQRVIAEQKAERAIEKAVQVKALCHDVEQFLRLDKEALLNMLHTFMQLSRSDQHYIVECIRND